MATRILVAIDGSEYSKKALEFACEMAKRFEASVHIVHVPQGLAANRVMVLGGAAVVLHASRDEIEQAGKRLIESAVEAAKEKGCDNVTTELRAGDPAQEIVESAKEHEADYLVIGNRGLGDFGSLLLGSVSNKINHSAPCTCITVH